VLRHQSIDPTTRTRWLSKPIKFVDDFFQGVCHDQKDRKKCRKCNALFTVDWQQDKVTSAKTASHPWLLSMFHHLTMVINMTFLNFMVGYRFGFEYCLQPGTSCSFDVPPACRLGFGLSLTRACRKIKICQARRYRHPGGVGLP